MKQINTGKLPGYVQFNSQLKIVVGLLVIAAGIGIAAWHVSTVQAATLQENVIGHWKLDETTAGATAVDASGNGKNGTPVGNSDGSALPQPSTNVPVVDFANPYSLSFDGDDDAVTTNLSLSGVGQFSAAGWIYPTATGNRISFFGQNDVLEFGFRDSSTIACYVGNSTTSTTVTWTFTAQTFPLNQWHHVACTNTGSAQVLYIDGTAVANAAVSVGVGNSSDTFTIGSGAWDAVSSGTGNFSGSIDDVYVYNRVLTAGEVSQLRMAGNDEIVLALQGGANKTHQVGTSVAINDLQITASSGNPNVPVKLLVNSGTLSMSTTTGLTFYTAAGVTGGPQTGAVLYFAGSLTDVNAALATLSYTRTSGAGSDTIETSLVSPGEVFFTGTNHLYEYVSVPGTINWANAKTAAESRSKYGAQGYLTTIASQAENNFVAARLLNAGWMGASDVTTEGTWRWVTGPEANTIFSVGNITPVTVSGQYANWNPNEPNDSGGEDCGQFLAGGTGRWNDLSCTSTLLPGYVVEYGAVGDMPTVAAKNIAITTSDTIAPVVTGSVTIPASPTTDATPTLSWTAATDAGLGLANPAYRLQWSTNETFAGYVMGGSNSMTASTTSATVPTNLSDGTWYFRVIATDLVGNATTSTISNALVVDTTNPLLSSVAPTDDVTNAVINAQLILTFSENIRKGTGTVTIKRSVGAATEETINVSSSAVVVVGNTATISLSSDLANDTGYYVEVSAGAFEDMVGNDFAGLSGASVWNFTTVKTPSQVAIEKIQDYVSTNGTSTAPTPSDYSDAGVNDVTSQNVSKINTAIVAASSGDVSDASTIQAFIDPVVALAKINDYALSAGASSVPTVSDYTTAGIQGVNSQNIALINSAVANGGSSAATSLGQLQTLVDESIAESQRGVPGVPNTGIAPGEAIVATPLLLVVGGVLILLVGIIGFAVYRRATQND